MQAICERDSSKMKRLGLAELWRWVREPAGVIALVLLSNTAIAQPFYIPSGSMEPTLAIGDAIIASKAAYGYSRYSLPVSWLGPASNIRLLGRIPSRGDVVVFRFPRDPHVNFIKRVIGLPGDRVQMKKGRLSINGQVVKLTPDGSGLEELSDGHTMRVQRLIETLPGGVSHLIYKAGWDGPLDNTAVFHVPAGRLFVMGDNRDDSLDSRVPAFSGGVGYVPLENLVGRADLIFASYDFLNAKMLKWANQVRLSRFFKLIG